MNRLTSRSPPIRPTIHRTWQISDSGRPVATWRLSSARAAPIQTDPAAVASLQFESNGSVQTPGVARCRTSLEMAEPLQQI